MWLSRKMFETLLHDRSLAQGRAQELDRQNTALHATMDWMRVQLNQTQHERAVLVENYMGVKLPVQTIETATPQTDFTPLNELPSFHDVGDVEAARMGISWNDDGSVKHTK